MLRLVLLTSCILSSASATDESFRFKVETVAEKFARPMGFVIAPNDGSVLVIELEGKILRINPSDGSRIEIAQIDVFAKQENGLLGIALDPDFEKNGHLFLLYSPNDYVGQRISRFKLAGDNLVDEKKIIEWPTQRDECCHHGGMLQFGPDGLLYASAGDNTHPFGDSQSFAPIDRRPGRGPWNAEKSAANPNDLRGGIIRIKIEPDASYSIPDGNLFPVGTAGTRPEIYVMGCRNPWKFSVDPRSGALYWGEVGPDANNDGPRGPRGYDEINQARKAGNFGWPYFIANNRAYSRVDFTTGKVGEKFKVEKPLNDSPLNTGAKELPPAQEAFIYWPYGNSEKWPILGKGGRTACAGPVFYFKPEFEKTGGFPERFDHCLLFWDWNRTFIKWARLGENEELVAIEEFEIPATIKRPSDARFADDGTLWFLDYGTTWANNADAKLLHISYLHGDLPPVARIEADPLHGAVPLNLSLRATGSTDPEGKPLEHLWFIDGERFVGAPSVITSLKEPGDHEIKLVVIDAAGNRDEAVTTIIAGNSAPQIAFEKPLDGSFFTPGEAIDFSIRITDPEDGDSSKDPAKFGAAVVTLAAREVSSPGLEAIRASDCFNCHHATQKLVGPAFAEIAERYKGDGEAAAESAKRIIAGSTKVWGEVPMLPHPHLSPAEARAMVDWIFSIDGKKAPQVARGVSGKFVTPGALGSLELSANFTDAGNAGASSLSEVATIRLRSRTVQAEDYDALRGPQVLGHAAPETGKFIGAINHGHSVSYSRFLLEGCKTLTFRYASAQHGATVSIVAGDEIVATAKLGPTGGWNDWQEMTVPLADLPGGATDVLLKFSNPGKSGILNIDWFRFDS